MHSLLGESGIAGRLEWRGFAGNRGLLHSPEKNGKNWLFLRYILHSFDRRVIRFKQLLIWLYNTRALSFPATSKEPLHCFIA
ncbi:hypothetical protein F6X50_11615 [Dickeya dianthicola]|uniref:hypothetical protein n=1 Tax=Dickeya TaxID=204037 RepID=UPI00119C9C4E|nr:MULTISPECIES: hypothetical protein [Dickeya]MCI4235976.1 hypothetical protein [Dickeya dianthicola]MCI4253949.1 hypothetical protein [Dickeya dianthicola]MZG20994.1 hypothetical protein [Dickeya dianthicola]MZI89737.1 hypothetical protein [Dickeya dianthicola]